jgi:hypothetical protein
LLVLIDSFVIKQGKASVPTLKGLLCDLLRDFEGYAVANTMNNPAPNLLQSALLQGISEDSLSVTRSFLSTPNQQVSHKRSSCD